MKLDTPTTREQFLELAPLDKLVVLSRVLNESADRCAGNMLTSGTWIEDTFRTVAADLYSASLFLNIKDALESEQAGV